MLGERCQSHGVAASKKNGRKAGSGRVDGRVAGGSSSARTEGTQVLKRLVMLPRVQELTGVTVAEAL
jgi:hypothetical protein